MCGQRGKRTGGRSSFYICARKERVKSWVNTEQKRKICSELSYYCNIGSGYRVLGFINVTKSRSWKAQTFFFNKILTSATFKHKKNT